jgi:hypothetical protein
MATARGWNIAAAAAFCLLAGAGQADAQSVSSYSPGIKVLYAVVPPSTPLSTPPTTTTVPTTPTVTPTPTPVVVTPPVVTTPVVTTTVPRMPDRPGMFMNIPSDMRGMTGLNQVTSIDRLLTTPGLVAIALPRQARPNLLENRPSAALPATVATGTLDATRALENARPLL